MILCSESSFGIRVEKIVGTTSAGRKGVYTIEAVVGKNEEYCKSNPNQ